MVYSEDDEVQTTKDLGAKDGPDFVPKGTRGFLKSVSGSLYPYIFYARSDMYMPWLVDTDDITKAERPSYAS